MLSLRYLFDGDMEQGLLGVLKTAASRDTISNASHEIGQGVKRFANKIGSQGLAGTVYNATHDSDTGASLGGRILKTQKATGLEQDNNAFQIAKHIQADRGRNPEVTQQWGQYLKNRARQR